MEEINNRQVFPVKKRGLSINNKTNIIKYRFLAPVYDLIMGSPIFAGARKKGLGLLEFRPGQKVLLVGIGTGQDLSYIPGEVSVTGVDLSEEMLARAAKRKRGAELILMNAEELSFADGIFDVVVLNLILSVVENPGLAMAEARRVLKEDGRILVFDKFLPEGKEVSLIRKMLNIITSFIGTDINRRFSDVVRGLPLDIINDGPAGFSGNYRTILAVKRPLRALGDSKQTRRL